MSDNADWKGRRLGPYEVGERYPDVPEDEGHLYEAHHTGTGAPALVVMPGTGEEWRTPTAWSTQTTSFTDPPALIAHTEAPTGAKKPTLHEQALGHLRMAGALMSLDDREDARAHFARAARPPACRWRRHWAVASLSLALVVGGALLLWPREPEQAWNEARSPPQEPRNLINTRDVPFPVIAYPMPEKPLKEQATPPCIPVTEVEIRGGCWAQHKHDAPCPPGSAEYQGHCYMPVKKKDPEPRSVDP
ncbi:hypothetical protein [Melittangium boletus]|uniref:Uncharacterized protein n=1 Tax=Melittangium boletus DSM 14713 TaxID=1294270 RepID=A0A250IQA1_9BACT|nr:hypothetical protein [Melittangium boletus]ATB33420.1 hypothetical protein MEBOL_006915 [Melittangium boletus DSM 14713]